MLDFLAVTDSPDAKLSIPATGYHMLAIRRNYNVSDLYIGTAIRSELLPIGSRVNLISPGFKAV